MNRGFQSLLFEDQGQDKQIESNQIKSIQQQLETSEKRKTHLYVLPHRILHGNQFKGLDMT